MVFDNVQRPLTFYSFNMGTYYAINWVSVFHPNDRVMVLSMSRLGCNQVMEQTWTSTEWPEDEINKTSGWFQLIN